MQSNKLEYLTAGSQSKRLVKKKMRTRKPFFMVQEREKGFSNDRSNAYEG